MRIHLALLVVLIGLVALGFVALALPRDDDPSLQQAPPRPNRQAFDIRISEEERAKFAARPTQADEDGDHPLDFDFVAVDHVRGRSTVPTRELRRQTTRSELAARRAGLNKRTSLDNFWDSPAIIPLGNTQSLQQRAYSWIFNSLRRSESQFILYPYSFNFSAPNVSRDFPDGALFQTKPELLPYDGYFTFLRAQTNVTFGRAKALYDNNFAILKVEGSYQGKTIDLTYESDSFCTIFSLYLAKTKQCLRGPEFLKYRSLTTSFTVFLNEADIQNGTLIAEDGYTPQFSMLIVPDIVAGSQDTIASILGTSGIAKLKEYVQKGGMIYASAKASILLEKLGLLSTGTVNTGYTLVAKNNLAATRGCDDTSDSSYTDFVRRTLCFSLPYSTADRIRYNYLLSSYLINRNADSTLVPLVHFNQSAATLLSKRSTSTGLTAALEDDAFLPMVMYKPYGKGSIVINNGHSALRNTFFPWVINAAMLSLSHNAIFDTAISVGNMSSKAGDLVIPGLEENIILKIAFETVNLAEDALSNVQLLAWLPPKVSMVDDHITGCTTGSDIEAPRDDVNGSIYWNCTINTVQPYQRSRFQFTIQINDASVTQRRWNILLLYPRISLVETRTQTKRNYEPSGVLVNAQMAAVIRSGLNPDPSSFYPIKGAGQYVDNVLYAENKEDSEAESVEHVAVIPIVSPVTDGDDQAALIRTIALWDQYYKQSTNGYADYHFPFRALTDFDVLDYKLFTDKNVVLNADWDTPVKLFKIDRVGFPEFDNGSSWVDDVRLVNYSTNVHNRDIVTKQVYFKDADNYFEHGTQRQLVFVDVTKPSGARTKWPTSIPVEWMNPNKPGPVAKTELVFVRNDVYFYDDPNYPKLDGLNETYHVLTIDRYNGGSPEDNYDANCSIPFGDVRARIVKPGYFDDTKPDGILANEYNNELLMNCDRKPLRWEDIETASGGKVKKTHYLVPIVDTAITKSSDILNFDPVTEGYEGYPEIRFIWAHATTFLLDPAISRKGGRLDFYLPPGVHFTVNDPVANSAVTYSADKVAFIQTTFDAARNVISAYFHRGHMPDEQYGQPSVLSVNFEFLDTMDTDVPIRMEIFEMMYDLSSDLHNYQRFFFRDNATRNATRVPFFSFPAVRASFKLARNIRPYEYLEPFVRYGVYIQEVLKHRTVWGSAESHHPTDPGLTSLSAGFSTLSNIGISSIPFREFLTTGVRQMIPSTPETSRVSWRDIWAREWSQPVRSVFPDVPPIPPPLRNFMMTTTFELTKPLTGERVLEWPSDEPLDIRVHMKLLNNYPKFFDPTYCKDNQIVVPSSNLTGTDLFVSHNYDKNYGVCFSRNTFARTHVTLSGQELTPQQLLEVKNASLCAESLRDKNCSYLYSIPTLSRRSNDVPSTWNFAYLVEDHYPLDFIKGNMWDLTHYDYSDDAFAKGYPYHMDNHLPQMDTGILRPHNIIAQPIWKGFGYQIDYSRTKEVPRFPGKRGWWSDNLQNRDHTLLAGQTISRDVAVGTPDSLLPSDWIPITQLNGTGVQNTVHSKLGNIYTCLFNRHRVRIDPENPRHYALENVLQNNVIPIVPDLSKYDARLTSYPCDLSSSQYSPDNISQFDNRVYTNSGRDWLYFAANLRGGARENLNVLYSLVPFSDIQYEGTAKVADGGRFVYWNPANGPNSFLMVDNQVNVVQAKRNDLTLDSQLFPVSVTTFDAPLYHLLYIGDEAERGTWASHMKGRLWTSPIWINHYGFGDSSTAVYVGEVGTSCILTPGNIAIARITLYNNCGFDWNMVGRAIESIELDSKPINANDLLSRTKHAIQLPTKYNFLTFHIPEEIQPFVSIIPSDHNIGVAPLFFDFQNINVATIRDGFKGDYFVKIILNETMSSGPMPDTLRGRLWQINVTLNEQYFESLPNYNSFAPPGYHDYKLLIPPLVIAVPFSSAVQPSWQAGMVFWTSGYSTDLHLTHKIPSKFTIQGARYVPEDRVPEINSMSLNEESKYTLLANFFNGLSQNATYQLTRNPTEELAGETDITTLDFDLAADFPQFPLPFKNSTQPDQKVIYILVQTHADLLPYGWNKGALDSQLGYRDFVGKEKHSVVHSPPVDPGYRTVYAKGAWVNLQYEGFIVDSSTLLPLYLQQVRPDKDGILRIIVKITNDGSDIAYQVNVTLLLPEDVTVATENMKKEDYSTHYSNTTHTNIMSILTHTDLPPGELMAQSVYLRYPALRNNTNNSTRSLSSMLSSSSKRMFISSVEVRVDLVPGNRNTKMVTQRLDQPFEVPIAMDPSPDEDSVTLDVETIDHNSTLATVRLSAQTASDSVDILFYFKENDTSVWTFIEASPSGWILDTVPVQCDSLQSCHSRRDYMVQLSRGSILTYDPNDKDVIISAPLVVASAERGFRFDTLTPFLLLLGVPVVSLVVIAFVVVLVVVLAIVIYLLIKKNQSQKMSEAAIEEALSSFSNSHPPPTNTHTTNNAGDANSVDSSPRYRSMVEAPNKVPPVQEPTASHGLIKPARPPPTVPTQRNTEQELSLQQIQPIEYEPPVVVESEQSERLLVKPAKPVPAPPVDFLLEQPRARADVDLRDLSIVVEMAPVVEDRPAEYKLAEIPTRHQPAPKMNHAPARPQPAVPTNASKEPATHNTEEPGNRQSLRTLEQMRLVSRHFHNNE